MDFGYYPGWETGYVRDYLFGLNNDGQRKKAVAKILFDVQVLADSWPRPHFVTVRPLKGHEPLWELKRDYQGIAYRVFFCVKTDKIWLLHAIEKKSDKTPISDLEVAFSRMNKILKER
jgi:phage-related protein